MNKTAASQKVVLISAIFVFGLGWSNSQRHGKNPSARFVIGAGITFTLLSFLADFSPEAANAFALAIATTALFSEGNGVLSYINKTGEINTPTPSQEKAAQNHTPHPVTVASNVHVGQIPGM